MGEAKRPYALEEATEKAQFLFRSPSEKRCASEVVHRIQNRRGVRR